MAEDLILFIHGVNTRSTDEHVPPSYADMLIKRLKQTIPSHLSATALYWGDLTRRDEDQLLDWYRESPLWRRMWYLQLRERLLFHAQGDGLLYLGRCVGAEIVKRLTQQALDSIAGRGTGDRLHLVTHSLGTIIFFDLLFSNRWSQSGIPGHDEVMALRKAIYGIDPHQHEGIRLTSIATMGSPIGLFSLVEATTPDCPALIAPPQQAQRYELTEQLNTALDRNFLLRERRLPWFNFLHPGDPVATPLQTVIPHLVQNESILKTRDVVIFGERFTDYLFWLLNQTVVALLHTGYAHQSYWQSRKVSDTLANTIMTERTANTQ